LRVGGRWPKWEMAKMVNSPRSCRNVSQMAVSLSESSALVASSRMSSLGLWTSALAMAIRCRCPPEILLPRSPTVVFIPCGRPCKNSQAPAALV
jgi:hypothetical protein